MDMASKMTGGDTAKMKLAGEIVAECKTKGGDPDPCQSALDIGVCVMVNGKKGSIDFGP